MKGASYIVCGTTQELAEAMGTEIRNCYCNFLQFWANALREDEELHNMYLQRMETEPQVVEKSVCEKITQIMENRKENKRYYKKYLPFIRSRHILIISNLSDFYDDLLPNGSIAYAFMLDPPYIVNQRECTIQKMDGRKRLTFS